MPGHTCEASLSLRVQNWPLKVAFYHEFDFLLFLIKSCLGLPTMLASWRGLCQPVSHSYLQPKNLNDCRLNDAALCNMEVCYSCKLSSMARVYPRSVSCRGSSGDGEWGHCAASSHSYFPHNLLLCSVV